MGLEEGKICPDLAMKDSKRSLKKTVGKFL